MLRSFQYRVYVGRYGFLIVLLVLDTKAGYAGQLVYVGQKADLGWISIVTQRDKVLHSMSPCAQR